MMFRFKEYFKNLKSYITIEFLKGKSALMSQPMNLVDVVNTFNQTYSRRYPPVTGPIDAEIFKNTPERNAIIAGLIVSEANRTGLDPVYLAACIMEESMFSEGCFNHNLPEHNGQVTFAGTDWGICQQAGTYLPERPGMPPAPDTAKMTTTEAASAITNWQNEMAAKACTAEWAIPAMADIMKANVSSFTKLLSSNKTLAANLHALNTTPLTDVEFIATLAYNRGSTGATNDILNKATTLIAHPYAVATHYSDFVKAMGTK
jgi:hypothetical protein